MSMVPDLNACTKDSDMPGLDEVKTVSEKFQLRSYKVIYVPTTEPGVQPF